MNDDHDHRIDERTLRRKAQMKEARKRYQDRVRKTHKRVYGTLTNDEYAQFQQRAEEARRAVWTQIQKEAEAYARGEYLPPQQAENRIAELVLQLRRIGNNLNQIARQLNTNGEFENPEFLQQFRELENAFHNFMKQPWGTPPPDDEAPPS